ncbi:MAG TPA: MFS transporter [Planctomycetes bacterium]|nr:MFS transporter [Planctomycetota bacterium]
MLELLRKAPEFRRLWIAQVVSEAGDWLNRMAVLALIGALGGGAQIGALFGVELVVRLLPTALMGPIAGPIADRVSRKALMIASDLARALTVLALLFVHDAEDLPLLYTLLIVQMSISIFFQAARSASIPRTVAKEDLHTAFTLTAATWSMMLSIGALFGGVLVSWIGPDGVFLCDAASYVTSALFLARIDLGPAPQHPDSFDWKRIATLADMRDGFAHVRSLGLAWTVFAKSFWGGAGGFLVLLSLAGTLRFGGAAGEASAAAFGTSVGMLYFARGVGTGVGPVLARRWFGSTDSSLRRQVAGGFVVGAVGYLLFGQAPSLPLAVLAVFFAHTGGSAIWVASTLLWQKHVDDRFRGRVYALEFLGMTVSFSLGGLLTGLLYDASRSITATVTLVSLVVLASGLLWARLASRASHPA